MKLKHVVVLGLMVIMLAPMYSFAVQSQLQTLRKNLGALQGNLQTLSEQLNALKEKIAPIVRAATDMSNGDASVDNGGGVSGHGVTDTSQAFTDKLGAMLDSKKAAAGAAIAFKMQDEVLLKQRASSLKNGSYEYQDLNDFLQILCTDLELTVANSLKKNDDNHFTVSLPNAVLMEFSLAKGSKYQFGNVIKDLSNIQSTFPKALTIDLKMEDNEQTFSATQLVSYLGSNNFISKNNKSWGFGQTWWAFNNDQDWLFQTQHDASSYANCETPSEINAQSALRIYVASNHLSLESLHKLRLYTFVLGLAQAAMAPVQSDSADNDN